MATRSRRIHLGNLLFISAIGFIVLLFFILKTFVVVPNKAAYIKERLGKYNGTLEAGFHFLIPIIDRVAYKHTLKEQVIDVPPQVCITKDNVQVQVDGILYLRVLDPRDASYGINNYRYAASQLAQTSMRSEIGKMLLDVTFKEREKINDAVVESVDIASDPWGVKVTRYEIKNIIPPQTVLDAMEQQMKAEREKRAAILHSEGQRQATINRSEGKRQEAINVSQGNKQKRINEAEGMAREIELVAVSTAGALRLVAEQIQKPGGNDAVRLRVAQEFIKQFGDVIQNSQTSVVPLSLANIQGFFEGFSRVTDGLKPLPGQTPRT